MKTKKALLALLQDGPVTATVTGMSTIEDIPTLNTDLTAKGYVLNPHTNWWCDKTGRIVSVPKLERIRNGIFKFRSRAFDFTWNGKTSGGEIVSLRATEDDGLALTTVQGGTITYRRTQVPQDAQNAELEQPGQAAMD